MSTQLQNLDQVRKSVVALGIKLADNRVQILGSGFCVRTTDSIVSSAHIYNQVPTEHIASLSAMVMVRIDEHGLEHYAWFPITLVAKNDVDDVALFKISDSVSTLLTPLEIGDSNSIAIGQDAYIVGFPYAAQLINDGLGITLVVQRTMISNIKQDGIQSDHPRNLIIVDAISNPGNSGGPLVDAESGKIIGVMAIAFRTPSHTHPGLDIREPMHIAGARPSNLVHPLIKTEEVSAIPNPA